MAPTGEFTGKRTARPALSLLPVISGTGMPSNQAQHTAESGGRALHSLKRKQSLTQGCMMSMLANAGLVMCLRVFIRLQEARAK